MRREVSYALVIALIAIGILGLYYIGGGPTGYAILGQYTTEADCVNAGYTWENLTEQNCTTVTTCVNETVDCEPCLEYEDINGTPGDCILWSSCEEETCTDEEDCVDVVIGGQCVGEVCDSNNLNLCLDETNCTGAGGYWYSDACNAGAEVTCSDDLSLCLDETNCTDAAGYWYDDVCNVDECEIDEHCASGYECDAGIGSCVSTEEEEEEGEVEEISEEEEEEYVPRIVELSVGVLPSVSLNPDTSQEISWRVSNTGNTPVSACKINPLGDFAYWILAVDESQNLNVGDGKDFKFSILIPEDAEEGDYVVATSVQCAETTVAREINVNVEKKKLEFEIISADRTRKTRVRILYSITELIGEDQNVGLYFSLLDANGQEAANATANRTIKSNSTKEFRNNLVINESLEGNLSLSVNFNSEIYSSSVHEIVSIGAPVGGFAIFGEGGLGTGGVIILLIFVGALVAIFFIVRKNKAAMKK